MTQAPAVAAAVEQLAELVGYVGRDAGFSQVVATLLAGGQASLEGAWGSARALVAAALAHEAPGPLLVVCPHAAQIDPMVDDLALFSTFSADRFPAWESEPGEQLVHDEIYAERLRLLKRLAREDPPKLVVASIQSLLQPVPSRGSLAEATRRLVVGRRISSERLLAWLAGHGFHPTSAVEWPGEFASRGGIIDVFAPDWLNPVRLELFGDQLESLRSFDVSSQRSLEQFEAVDITLVAPAKGPDAERVPGTAEHLADYLPASTWVVWIEPAELEREGGRYRQHVDRPDALYTVRGTLQQMGRFPAVTVENFSAGGLPVGCRLDIESVERFSGQVSNVRSELESVGEGQQVFVVCSTEAETKRLEEILLPSPLAGEGRLHFLIGRLSEGFRLIGGRTLILSGAELFQRTQWARTARRRLGRAIDSFLELREGDLVVHLAHGIGRYRGLRLLGEAHSAEEHLEIEFHGGTKVYVPSAKIDLVQRYIGAARARPSLAKIGGKTWVRQKAAAQRAVTDLAADLLELQARRCSQPGIAFPADSVWQQEFDASFPYQETADQLTAMEAIKQDMGLARPMDRLLCGDVGFGKTELSIRAAFKAIDAGYQVAVLVPTTVLAEQHRRTFSERMAEFPFEIATLSRFGTRKQQGHVLEGLAQGTVDVVIGTHRLAQPDVRFQNLGLIIIDEEQRFGVAVKERLKSLRTTVDVLTMTATPIPRTLHMSLMGVRNISNLETPPEDRLAVETRVARWNEELIRHAVLRELSRDGQIYFVHNRVRDIEAVAARLRRIVPEAQLEIGHGQMPEAQLEKVMLRFLEGKFDLLLATTIVESGLDIPNANTMLIDEADRYGLADLHQLRGRVGRYKHRAYCYLLIDPKSHVAPEAARRLRAIEEFSYMGAGFGLAMRDLEIRGAGNILGTEQSGHIAAVGYELYCSLLDGAVRHLKHLPPRETVEVHIDLPGAAYLPETYVPDMRSKIDLYRRLARMTRPEELDDLAAELADRFGPRPEPVKRLLQVARLRIWAQQWQIGSIRREDSFLVLSYGSRVKIEALRSRSGGRLRVVDDRNAYLPIEQPFSDPDPLQRALESLLRPASDAGYNPAPPSGPQPV